MATVLTKDVLSYRVKRGPSVYTCSLDAQGAFDSVPHETLFAKALGIVPDHCWVTLVAWYQSIVVRVKWGNKLSNHISVQKGTRQGGLSSPFLLNVFTRILSIFYQRPQVDYV